MKQMINNKKYLYFGGIIISILLLSFFIILYPDSGLKGILSENSPYNYNRSLYLTEKDDLDNQNIGIEVSCAKEVKFENSSIGGAFSYFFYFYNKFVNNGGRDLTVFHSIAITALLNYTGYINQNNSWVQINTSYEWKPIPNLIQVIGESKPKNQTLLDMNKSWVVLNDLVFGGTSKIQGYSVVETIISNSIIKDYFEGISTVSEDNKTKIVVKSTKIRFRDEVNWKIYWGPIFGWTSYKKKIYYLGNDILEGKIGIEFNGIRISPES